MKIVISSDGDNMYSMVDQRFGRCKYFLLADSEHPSSLKAVENEGALQGHGAGIKAAEQIGKLGAEVVLTGNLGPNASDILTKLGIKAYNASGKVKDALDIFIKGNLEEIKDISELHNSLSDDKEENDEKIFFPLLEDNGEDSTISEHFGHAPFFGVYDTKEKKLDIISNDLDHTDPTKSPIDQIEEAVNPTTIFAKGIGGRAIGIIAEKGLKLKTGNYDTVKEVIENLDKLEDQSESCGHEH